MSSIPESGATWSTWPEARAIVRQNLRRTITIALVVGSILFVINQLDVVLSGKATIVVWLKIGLTFCVPFCVSNYGCLVATKRRATSSPG